MSQASGQEAVAGGISPAGHRLSPDAIVVAVAGIAVLLTAAVATATSGGATSPPLVVVPWLDEAKLPVLLLLTFLAEYVTVRIKRGDFFEGLTLVEAGAVVNVLLLPPSHALVVTTVGLGVAHLVRRRAALKVVFNLATTASSTAVLVACVHLLTVPGAGLDTRLVVALTVGAAGFVAINLLLVGWVVSAVNGGSLGDFVRQEARMSALMAVGSVAIAATAVLAAVDLPALMPFCGLPAAAMTYAYRAAADQADERERSRSVLQFSQTLAASPSRDVAVSEFLILVRHIFDAGSAVALLDDGTDRQVVVGDSDLRDEDVVRFLAIDARSPILVHERLPGEWVQAVFAPLEASGRRLGVIVLGGERRDTFAARDLTLIAALASALAVALRNAEYLDELFEETSKLKAVVEHSSDGILVLDGEGRIQLWNPAMERLTGYEAAEAIGRPLGSTMAVRTSVGALADPFDVCREALSPAAPDGAVELEVVRSDGEERSLRLAHSAVYEHGELVQDVVTVHDLTRRRQVERLKADFIATVSHELRTPVTPIKGYADLLRRRGETMTPEKRLHCAELISERADHLSRMVEDLLVAAKIGNDQEPVRDVTLGPADLVALVRRGIADFPSAASRLTLTCEEPQLMVRCDTTRTLQVLTNLLSNALKYSDDDAPVGVTVRRRGDLADVVVRDAGRGIPSDQLELIFDQFHRVEDPMIMTTGGTGLGLFIARSLARAMSGDLAVQSTLGTGSAFTFTIPHQGEPDA